MKPSLILIALLFATASQAQLLKKLKDKVEQKVEKKVTTETATTTPDDSGNTTNLDPKTVADEAIKIYTLEEGETFFYDESSLAGGKNKLIVKTRNGFKIIENGQVTPVKQLTPEQAKGGMGYVYTKNEEPKREDYVKMNAKYQTIVVFNGKTYGPFMMLMTFVLSPDKSNFYAVVGVNEKQVNYYLIDANNRKALLPTISQSILISEDGKSAAAIIIASLINAKKGGNMDTGNTSWYAYNINGTNLGPLPNYGDEMWVGNDGTVFTIPAANAKASQLFANGKPAVTFPEKVVNQTMFSRISHDNVLVGSNPAKAAVLIRSGLGFADGRYFTYNAFRPEKITVAGKSYLTWFMVFGKDVYACKNAL